MNHTICPKPGCGQKLRFEDSLRGKRVKCPKCGEPFEIPAASQPSPSPSSPQVPSPRVATAQKCAHCGEWLDERTRPAAGSSAATTVRNDDGVLLVTFVRADPDAFGRDVGEFFRRCRYRLESGSPQRATYRIGNDVRRLLFGGLTRRYKFDVDIQLAAAGVRLRVAKAMSGAMGGVIGYQAMKKETRIFNGLRQRFAV